MGHKKRRLWATLLGAVLVSATPAAGQTTQPAPANRPPTVRTFCEPCTVDVGRVSTFTADAQDPDGDPLTYRWTANAGSLTTPNTRQTPWTAPSMPGVVPVTVTITDGKGGTVSALVSITVVLPQAEAFTCNLGTADYNRALGERRAALVVRRR